MNPPGVFEQKDSQISLDQIWVQQKKFQRVWCDTQAEIANSFASLQGGANIIPYLACKSGAWTTIWNSEINAEC